MDLLVKLGVDEGSRADSAAVNEVATGGKKVKQGGKVRSGT